MRSVALDFEHRDVVEWDAPAPELRHPADVLFRVLEVGVCGTDRELAGFHLGRPPEGERRLVLGHEALGQVEKAGPESGFAPGDLVAPMVRRACQPPCVPCHARRADLCETGAYTERGIFGLHGYFTALAVDHARDLVRIPLGLRDAAVLVEPMSVVEKSVGRALAVWRGHGIDAPAMARALVLGAGPVGLLAGMLLRSEGIEVYLESMEDAGEPRALLARDAGFTYVRHGAARPERFDITVEAAGSAAASFTAMRALGQRGVSVVLGASQGTGEVSFRDLVVLNQSLIGSVNTNPESFQAAAARLERFDRRILNRMIERTGFDSYRASLYGPPPDRPKIVHSIS